jgi:gluconolactonase
MKTVLAVLVGMLTVTLPICTHVRAAEPIPAVVKLDAALDGIVAPDARFEILKSDYFGISEGPVWIQRGRTGYLLFSDIGANAIYKWTPNGTLSVFLKNSGYTGEPGRANSGGHIYFNGRLNVGTFGSNGIVADLQGRLIFCAHGDRAIVRIESDGKRTVLADRYEGKGFNKPNDLVLKSNGAIYFTDPPSVSSAVTGVLAPTVFLLKNATVKMLVNDLPTPNGLAFSPDEKYLYVNDTKQKLIMRYNVQPDDTIANGRVFMDMKNDKAPGVPDGMKVDAEGNVYCIGPGGIWIMSPQGKHLGTILLPDIGTNLNFGDTDGKTLYVTYRRSLGRIRVKIKGALWKTAQPPR